MTETTTFVVRIVLADQRIPGKLADAELVFKGGPLDGKVLVGFTIWQHAGKDKSVTFPSRPYTPRGGGERRFQLLRQESGPGPLMSDPLCECLLSAYDRAVPHV